MVSTVAFKRGGFWSVLILSFTFGDFSLCLSFHLWILFSVLVGEVVR